MIHKNSVHLFSSFVQHLCWYVLCASSSVTPPCSQRVRGGGLALLRYLARITLKSCAQKKRTECEEKPFSSLPGARSRVRLHHQFSPSFSVVIRRAAFSGTCPYVFAPKSPLRLAREKDIPFGISSDILLIQPSRRILSSIDIGTVPSFQLLLCVLNVNLTDSDDVHED